MDSQKGTANFTVQLPRDYVNSAGQMQLESVKSKINEQDEKDSYVSDAFTLCYRAMLRTAWLCHRRRLLEMTVGRDSPLHLQPSLPFEPLLPHISLLSPAPPSLVLLPSCLSLSPFPYIYPLNPTRGLGERGSSPAAKRFWCIFKLKSAHFLSLA